MDKLSAKHFVLFIFGVTFISFKTYPSIFIELGGRDTWICVAISFIIFILFAMYLIRVAYSRKIYNINEIFTLGLPKVVGNILLFLFAVGLFLASLESATIEANVVKTCFFNETPTWYIIMFFILPSFFLIGKRLRTILIFTLISVSTLLFNSVILALITEKYKDIEYIMPVLSQGLEFSLFSTSLLVLGSLSAFVISLPYLKYVTNDSKIKKHSFIALSLLAFLCTYTIIGILSTFGPLRAANIFYPEFIQSQRVQIAGFLEFGELFFLFQSIIGLFIKYVLCSYGIYIIYEKHITNHKVYITIYSLAIFIFATFLSRNNYVLFDLLKYYQVINIILFIVIPLIAFLSLQLKVEKKI